MPPQSDLRPLLRRNYQYSVREALCLSKDAISRMSRGESKFKPRLQVLRVNWPSNRTDFRDKFRVVLSDGVHHCLAMWPAQLNERIKSGAVSQYSLVQLLEYSCRPVKRQPFIIIQSVQLLKTTAPLLGAPTPHPSMDDRYAPPSPISVSAVSAVPAPRPSSAVSVPRPPPSSRRPARTVHRPLRHSTPASTVAPSVAVVPRRPSRPATRPLASPPPALPAPPAAAPSPSPHSSDEAGSSRGTCAVCLSEGVETVAFVHGKTAHQCCCMPCAKKCLARSGRCPMCRKFSTSIVRVYHS